MLLGTQSDTSEASNRLSVCRKGLLGAAPTNPEPTNAMTSETPASPRIRDLPKDERPREKLALRGAASLSDAELLAIFFEVVHDLHLLDEVARV